MNTPIPYAGDQQRKHNPSAHSLFLAGHDTATIAAIRGEPEHVVLRALTVQRAKAKGFPVETAPSPYLRGRVADWRARA
jgi:hypothetical protein